MHKKTIGCSILLLFIMLTPLSASDFRIVAERWAPFSYTQNGKPAGFAVEILQAALKLMDRDIPIEFCPWERAYRIATTEPNVLIFSLVRNEERENSFIWVDSIAPRQHLFFYKLAKRTDLKIRLLEEAKKYKIGCKSGSDASTLNLIRLGFQKDVNLEMMHEDESLNLKKLAAGRVDLIVYPEIQLIFDAKAMGYLPSDFEKTISFPGTKTGEFYYFAFSRGTSEENAEKLRTALKLLKKNGTYDAIWKKYLK